MSITLDASNIFQAVVVLSLSGLVADHFRLRSEISRLQSQFVPWEYMRRFEDKIDRNHGEVRKDLMILSDRLSNIMGQMGRSEK